MIIYNVIVTIRKEIEIQWLKWMKDIHIPDVMATGYFSTWQIQKQILPEHDLDEITYSINYTSESFMKYQLYAEKEAPRLQKSHIAEFGGKFKAERKVYEIIQ